jgi:transcriptional regulator with XRE-family HTH domain|nr:MAG TPA: repressor protein [Caudoviricetes sp.]DAM00594.1 MAG TPA: repressor protein [Caudoviricetes sp.]
MLDKIKALCKEKKTSISKLEKQLGFGNGVIGRWDKSVPSYERLAAVANALDVPVAYLTGETDDPSAGIKKDPIPKDGAVSQEKQLLLDMIDGLSDEQKELLALSKKMSDDELKRFIAAMKAMLGESM